MTYVQLQQKILGIGSDREWLIAPGGLEGRYFLFEKNVPGVALIDATPEEVLDYVRNNP